jgi:hypothetical protein
VQLKCVPPVIVLLGSSFNPAHQIWGAFSLDSYISRHLFKHLYITIAYKKTQFYLPFYKRLNPGLSYPGMYTDWAVYGIAVLRRIFKPEKEEGT